MTEENKEIIAYKGFGSDWKCRGYQYEIGKTYEHKGKVEACESGFHSCENPLDVLAYYDISSGSKYALVKASGEISRNDNSDTKISSSKIAIEVELNIHELLKSGFEWVMNKIFAKHKQVLNDQSTAATSGYRSTAATSGYQSTATNTGKRSAAEVSGEHSIAASFGEKSKARAGVNGAIVCVYRNDDGELIHIRASKVGENGIKPDTWYTLDENGDFVEVSDERN